MIVGLHHVALGVTDLRAATEFYRSAFGCETVFESTIDGTRREADRVIGIDDVKAEVVMLRLGAAHLELWQYEHPAPVDHTSPPNGLGYPHIAIAVTDIGAEHARLTELGMSFVGPPVDMGERQAVYGADPWGNVIELYEGTP